MKKNIWIMNHYATGMYFDEGGRHYWFAKELQQKGYKPVIFSCNVKHRKSGEGTYFEDNGLWSRHYANNIPFVVIRSTKYIGNGRDRIKNMVIFSINLMRTAREYARKYGKPDIIIASSVHPFTVFAGEKIAKRFQIPCICEIRDLWPESIFAYYPKIRKKPYAKLLLAGEKRMYKKADAIVMTWAGGAQYIKDMKWSKEIPESKVFHICNGVDLKGFDNNIITHPFYEEDLLDQNIFKVVYTGAIRLVNKIDMLVDVAEILEKRGNKKNIKILVWGEGDKAELIKKKIADRGIKSIELKGKVAKQNIPSILSQADCCILQYASTELDKFGQSQNKFFEYLASGKPVLMTYTVGYSIIEKYKCGIMLKRQTPEEIADALEKLADQSDEEKKVMAKNARLAAEDYDFSVLTEKLISIIERL